MTEANILQLYAGGIISRETIAVYEQQAQVIAGAVEAMIEAKIPQGLIVSLLHAHALQETQRLVGSTKGKQG